MIKYMSSKPVTPSPNTVAIKTAARRVGMPHLASRLFNSALMIHPAKLDAILHGIGHRLNIREDLIPALPEEPLLHKRDGGEDDSAGPVVMIPVYGTLVKRGGYVGESGMTSYDAITDMVNAAMKNADVKALLFDLDSPGGEAAGLFDFCQYVTSLRGSKPMIGISNDMAFSAAYALASCMDKLFVTGVGGVGSIGVYMLHTDQSQLDKQEGITYTYISSGEKKTDLNPHEPPSKSALADAQAEVDRIREMFVQLVAGNRKADPQKIRDTEAATYMGDSGCPLLADCVGTFDEAVAYAVASAAQKRSVAGTGIHVEFEKPEAAKMLHANKQAVALITLREELLSRKVMAPTAELWNNKLLVMRAFGTVYMAGATARGAIGTIRGLLAPYNSMSCNLGGFYEIYQPGCFKNFLESSDDALVLAFHNPEHVLGRRSVGTARFWEDRDGLWYEADLPDTQVARDLKTSIERGDVKGSSAAFYITQHRWEQRSGGRVRIIEEAALVEGSPHSFVAYSETSAVTSEEQTAAAAHDELLGYRSRLLKFKQQGAQYK